MDVGWKTALVTGASSGIGEAIARRLAWGGTDLVLVARRKELLDALAMEMKDAHGVDVEVLPADLTDPGDRARVEARAAAGATPIDLLVNNAGFAARGRVWELSVERQHQEIELNVAALVRLTHAALSQMVPRRQGAILNVSSVLGFLPLPYYGVYAGTKAFVLSFTEALHEELRGTGINATAILPGYTPTEFQAVAGARALTFPDFLSVDAAAVAREALDAAATARPARVAGAVNRITFGALRLVPRRLTRRLAGMTSRWL